MPLSRGSLRLWSAPAHSQSTPAHARSSPAAPPASAPLESGKTSSTRLALKRLLHKTLSPRSTRTWGHRGSQKSSTPPESILSGKACLEAQALPTRPTQELDNNTALRSPPATPLSIRRSPGRRKSCGESGVWYHGPDSPSPQKRGKLVRTDSETLFPGSPPSKSSSHGLLGSIRQDDSHGSWSWEHDEMSLFPQTPTPDKRTCRFDRALATVSPSTSCCDTESDIDSVVSTDTSLAGSSGGGGCTDLEESEASFSSSPILETRYLSARQTKPVGHLDKPMATLDIHGLDDDDDAGYLRERHMTDSSESKRKSIHPMPQAYTGPTGLNPPHARISFEDVRKGSWSSEDDEIRRRQERIKTLARLEGTA